MSLQPKRYPIFSFYFHCMKYATETIYSLGRVIYGHGRQTNVAYFVDSLCIGRTVPHLHSRFSKLKKTVRDRYEFGSTKYGVETVKNDSYS